MKLGCCIGLDRIFEDGCAKSAARLLDAGYTYVELPLAAVAALTDSEFDNLSAITGRERINIEACNVFFPGEIKLVGEHLDKTVLSAYLDKALERAGRLGAGILVVGSSGSRNVPEGYPREQAWAQLIDVFRMIADKITPYGIAVVIEPLNTKESNIINSLAEGSRLVGDVDRENIRLLADFYHMSLDGESIALEPYAGILKHTHFAEPAGRGFPREYRDSYTPFFNSLKKIGYTGGVSMECGSKDLITDAITALEAISSHLY